MLQKRFQNRPIVELEIAIGEEMKIIELRLASLFEDNRVEKLKGTNRRRKTIIWFLNNLKMLRASP